MSARSRAPIAVAGSHTPSNAATWSTLTPRGTDLFVPGGLRIPAFRSPVQATGAQRPPEQASDRSRRCAHERRPRKAVRARRRRRSRSRRRGGPSDRTASRGHHLQETGCVVAVGRDGLLGQTPLARASTRTSPPPQPGPGRVARFGHGTPADSLLPSRTCASRPSSSSQSRTRAPVSVPLRRTGQAAPRRCHRPRRPPRASTSSGAPTGSRPQPPSLANTPARSTSPSTPPTPSAPKDPPEPAEHDPDTTGP